MASELRKREERASSESLTADRPEPSLTTVRAPAAARAPRAAPPPGSAPAPSRSDTPRDRSSTSLRRRVDDREAGARIAVARLADRARVDQIAFASSSGMVERPVIVRGREAELIARQVVADLHVGVAEQAQRPARRVQRAQRVELVEDVGVLVERRAVADLDQVVDDHRARPAAPRASRGSPASARRRSSGWRCGPRR